MENLFRPIVRPLEDALGWVLDFLHEDLLLSYGWAIVVLTILVRIGLLPLWIRQYKSMRRLRVVQPQIKALQQKYKGNRQRQQEEMMALYREKGINPFGSCLPILPQVPIFIALFYLLRNFDPAERGDGGADLGFLWAIDDITADVSSLGFGAVILAIIYGTSQLISTELSAGPEQTQQIRWVFRLLPIGIVVSLFLFDWPAGVVLYWASTNLWTAGQQLVFRQKLGMHVASDEERAELMEGAAEADEEGDDEEEPSEEDDDAVKEGAVAAATRKSTPRRRRGRGAAAAAEAPEATTAPEADSGEGEARTAPEPQTAPEAEAVEVEMATENGAGDAEGVNPADVEAPTNGDGTGDRSKEKAGGSAPRAAKRTQPAKKGATRGAKASGKSKHGRRRTPRKKR
ncbi:MAG: YidC/Oxa1 family membrane protein insertase [Miltoncostaeaceae bacterium]